MELEIKKIEVILLRIRKFVDENEELVDLLCSNYWPFHSNQILNRTTIRRAVERGYYADGRETFWITLDEQKVGIIIIDDIEDTIPLFDLRLTEKARGKGIGVKSLLWLKDYLYGEKKKLRIEGYTRADNLAMRKCFTNAGFVKEGYLRNAWENENGTVTDAVLYASIYGDWKENKITQIKLREFPFWNLIHQYTNQPLGTIPALYFYYHKGFAQIVPVWYNR